MGQTLDEAAPAYPLPRSEASLPMMRDGNVYRWGWMVRYILKGEAKNTLSPSRVVLPVIGIAGTQAWPAYRTL